MEVVLKNKIMKFEKGKKVRLTKVFYENIPVNTILTMDNICAKSDYHFLCYEYPNDYIYFPDCEEITPTLEDSKPTHYQTRTVNGMDVIDLIKHWNLNFNEGNILKYLLRDKGQDIQDLEKILDYAQREIKHLNK